MKRLSVNDFCVYGESQSDMMTKALGNKVSEEIKCYVNLGDTIAWFVHMDGSKNGFPGWEWRNYLTTKDDKKNTVIPNGDTIREYLVSPNNALLLKRQSEHGFSPYRLAFRLDPFEKKDNKSHCCKFVGAYVLDCFLNKDLTAMQYVKIMDEYILGWKGDVGNVINTKMDFMRNGNKYFTPIENMGFSSQTVNILKRGGIKFLYELLEMGHGPKSSFSSEIRERLFFCMQET